MTTVSQIITDAYQYNNIVALSSIPNAAEQSKALRYLNRIFRSVFSSEIGEIFQEWNIGETYVSSETYCNFYDNTRFLFPPYRVPANSRLVLNLVEPTTVYLSPNPRDGARFAIQDISQNLATHPLTIDANGRRIEDSLSLVVSTDASNSEWFFRADLGNWVKVGDLALTDTFPLPTEFEEFFITMLALRLGASEDIDLNNQLSLVLREVSKKIKARYKQKSEQPSELGLVHLSNQNQYEYLGKSFSGLN